MTAELVGISFAIENGEACYIPIAHKSKIDSQADLFSETMITTNSV